MPVGTAATVKAMFPQDVRAAGADILLGNVYHLMLRPGAERVNRLGGLHDFMRWPYPILTDSGGFQVMSLAKLRKLDENGVTFQSHIDGSKHVLTPERSMEIQALLGSDIQMQFDECVRLPCGDAEAERAMRLSLRWAERSRKAFAGARGQAAFGIVQGGAVKPLRIESARALADMDFHGLAIGGLAVGEPQEVMLEMLETVEPHLPKDKPRYLMGVGTPDDIVQAVARGVDMFDCVMPTRAGRHGLAYTRFGKVNLMNARHAEDAAPLDAEFELRRGARLFARLSASSVQGGRNPRHDAADANQRRLLSGADGGASRGDRGAAARGFYWRDEGRLGAGAGRVKRREPSSDPWLTPRATFSRSTGEGRRAHPSPTCGRRWPREAGSDEGSSTLRQSAFVVTNLAAPDIATADSRRLPRRTARLRRLWRQDNSIRAGRHSLFRQ